LRTNNLLATPVFPNSESSRKKTHFVFILNLMEQKICNDHLSDTLCIHFSDTNLKIQVKRTSLLIVP